METFHQIYYQMIALITGASSGIGFEMAKQLLELQYDLILVNRTEGLISSLKNEYKDRKIIFISKDLTDENECYSLLKEVESYDIDIFINNAGFGDIGYFSKTSIAKEVNMVKLNDIASLILTKEFLIRFTNKNKGKILLTASAAAFGYAPYMNVYYASKNFVYALALGYYRELKNMKSKVTISVLCPGPVETNFEKNANCKFNMKPQNAKFVAKYAISNMMKGKLEIIPGFKYQFAAFLSHFVSRKTITKILNKQAEMK